MSMYRSETAGQQSSETAATIAGVAAAGQVETTRRFEGLRLQLARELHDRAGWHLSALNYGIFAVETEPDNREALAELRRRFDALTATLREITTDVRRGQKVRLDLVGELSALCSEWTRMTRVPVVLHSQNAPIRLSHRLAATFISLVREALTNVSKHAAGASRVEITLAGAEGEDIRVTVADDGAGIDPARLGGLEQGGHHGLAGMRERLARIGGTLEIRSGETRGAVLVFDLPRRRPQ